jgi:hypothetical protein
MNEPLYILIAVSVFCMLLPSIFEFLDNVKWSCLFGKHHYIYSGTRHGMVMHKTDRTLHGTSREVYRCAMCDKEKPQ